MSQIGYVLVLSIILYLISFPAIGQVKTKEKSKVKFYELLGGSARQIRILLITLPNQSTNDQA